MRFECHTSADAIIEQVSMIIADYSMVKRNELVLAAVSGGSDSIVLLEVLLLLRDRLGINLAVAHFDHQLRGDLSAADARFVEEFARARKLEVIVGRCDVRALCHREKVSLEEGARIARYRFLAQTAHQLNAAKVALGHTLDDSVETFLMHLIRGSGLSGLRGIPPVRLPYIRPLIACTRTMVKAFAAQKNLQWREDHTNIELTSLRNCIRHELLPLLTRYNPRIIKTIQRTEILMTQANDSLTLFTNQYLPMVIKSKSQQAISLDLAVFRSLDSSLQPLLIRGALYKLCNSLKDIEFVHIKSLLDLINTGSNRWELNLPKTTALKEGDTLKLLLQGYSNSSVLVDREKIFDYNIVIGENKLTNLGVTLTLSVTEKRPTLAKICSAPAKTEYADFDRITLPLSLRNRRPGDRFRPLGMATEKRLKDFFIDEHVPYAERRHIPLLCDAKKIIWVVGIRLADEVKITAATTQVLKMEIKEIE
ncbi:tRNA lysidine(34) synthetase TilS [Candidatus Acetothermia bacterium]|nr:tRNA lysidine(34) synthetase TilS [Candidatus Acetothermia bacterium]MCI2427038.1 tRNA lysidine(34) synthetase TilS [Candidatus Acetothermia bacterium]MCI2428259.1 tRNA lysidine(34) synthetase TilS [Candidatus Acetothermia bacterium]